MTEILEPQRRINVAEEVDICVVGGSCTGVFAAVRAARLGARVAVVEKQNCFGGVATAGLVNIWHSDHDEAGTKRIVAGLSLEVVERLSRRDAVRVTADRVNKFLLNTEELKIELDELVRENRIVPFLHTWYAAPHLRDGLLEGIIVEGKSGRRAIMAKVFVDASGDGDLCGHLGVERGEVHALQPPTCCAKYYGMESLGDWDWEAAVRLHGVEFGLEPDYGWRAEIPGVPSLTMMAENHLFDVDVADGNALSRAEMEGRRKVRALLDVLRAYGPPGSRVSLAALAQTVGARETRRYRGLHRLTGDELQSGRRFSDAVANGSYRVDIHHADGPGWTFRYLDGTEAVYRQRGVKPVPGRWRPVTAENPTFYQVPLRCLVPAGIPNLLMAGRMLDADAVAFSAVRVMINLNQTGEAAGVAAYLAVHQGRSVRDVDPAEVRGLLAAGGSLIL